MSQPTRLTVHRADGSSFHNMIQVLSGQAAASAKGEWIEVIKVLPGVYRVVGDSMTEDSLRASAADALGFCAWDDEVEDLDADWSDAAQCFGMSEHLRWHDVYLTREEFRAPSIRRLKEALRHVAFCAWYPGDI